VNIDAESHVISEVPADVIGVIVDDDVVAIPEPVATVANVKRRYAEVIAAKPEATGASAAEAPYETRTESTLEVAVLPSVIEVEAVFVPSPVMPNPPPILMDVRGVRMAFLIAVGGVLWLGRVPRSTLHRNRPAKVIMIGRRSTGRNIAAADSACGLIVVFRSSTVFVLRQRRESQDQRDSDQ